MTVLNLKTLAAQAANEKPSFFRRLWQSILHKGRDGSSAGGW
jgi:hypothetical protein